MPTDSRYPNPAIVIACVSPSWSLELQQVIRQIVGWDYDIMLTFSAKQMLRYIGQRSVSILISEGKILSYPSEPGVTQALQIVRQFSPSTHVLALHSAQLPGMQVDLQINSEMSFEDIGDIIRRRLGLGVKERAV